MVLRTGLFVAGLFMYLIGCTSLEREEARAIPEEVPGGGEDEVVTGEGVPGLPGPGVGAPAGPEGGAGLGAGVGDEAGGGPSPEGGEGGGPPPDGGPPPEGEGREGLSGEEAIQAFLVMSPLPPTGILWAWGDNSEGQLCDGTTESRFTPVRVLTGVLSVEGGDDHTVILKQDGSVWTCGHNQFGELGYETDLDHRGIMKSQLTPRQVLGLDHVVAVAAGGHFSMVLKEDGSVWTWGTTNIVGQVGSEVTSTLIPGPVDRLNHVKAIAAGSNFALALREVLGEAGRRETSLWAWGWNLHGGLGAGPVAQHVLTPVQVLNREGWPLVGIRAVAAGGEHAVAAMDAGVLTWGGNRFGQLCDRSHEDRAYANSGPWEASANEVAAGGDHTLGVDAWGRVWSCGDNSYGQLGVGAPSPWAAPLFWVSVPGGQSELRSIVGKVAAGRNHSLLLILNIDEHFGEFHGLGRGTVLAWGRNSAGQVGDGATTDRPLPVPISGLPPDVSAVAAGANHSLAVSAPPSQ